MKKTWLLTIIALCVCLLPAAPALAASLGISPSKIEVDVPAESSSTITLQAYYFKGDIRISTVDIPLRIEPELITVDALGNPEDIKVTIYGDETAGSQVYNGYIKFTGLSGDMVAIAVQVKARVANIVEGQPLPAAPEENAAADEAVAELSADPGAAGGLSINTVILIAGGLVFLGLVILATSLVVRRR